MRFSGFALRCVVHVTLVLFVVLGVQTVTTPVFAQGVRQEIADMLKRHDDALNQHNLDALSALYSPGANTFMMGTGPGEKFQGIAEIKAAYTEIFKDFDKGTMTHACGWKAGGTSGNAAWGGFMCKISDSKDGKKREFDVNVTAVAERRSGKWQFVLLHYSNLTGGGN